VWLTQDPYRGRLNEPMTLHRYGYVGDNPISFIDPYGFAAKACCQTSASSSYAGSGIKSKLVVNSTQNSPLCKSTNGGTKTSNLTCTQSTSSTVDSDIRYKKILENAEKLIGAGVNWDAEGNLKTANGQYTDLVCIDVPVISAVSSGFALKDKMKDDYNNNKNKVRKYDSGNIIKNLRGYNNTPENPNFYRRVTNVVTYLTNQGLYHPVDSGFAPKPGMLIVYNGPHGEPEYHSGVINEVKDGKVVSIIAASESTGSASVQIVQEKYLEDSHFTINGYGEWPEYKN